MKLKNYLATNRGEFRAILITTAFVCIGVLLPPNLIKHMYHPITPEISIKPYPDTLPNIKNTASNKGRKKAFDQKEKFNNKSNQQSPESRYVACARFDPNTVDSTDLISWGIPQYVIKNLLKYRRVGGTFRSADDLQKVYGMSDEVFARIETCIEIKKESFVIDLNSADTTALKSLPGIGSVLSARIIKFRDKLGGFYSISQVAETYGLSPETYQSVSDKLEIKTPHEKLTSLESSTLARHPYINYKYADSLSNLITALAERAGQAEPIPIKDTIWLQKVLPYLPEETTQLVQSHYNASRTQPSHQSSVASQ